ncbi:S-layer homology domain-containing protein [Qingrenia yutianensis]|uniref:S-layer homology domain-containing protein n=1 Tax=Qingrenia yutianensis TaxID=2763676 RepID=A0A926F7X8_9FIRM|nr:S-layer homology domain-containing protein [Qingrenia yutianensis]MBC8595883.1 S-layer homology domain-containing protein [Qingrenia yutianensis]
MNFKSKLKNILSAALAVSTLLSGFTPITTYAAQVNEYVDPADIWVSANGRTNELDFNATITQETSWCTVCNKDTIMLTYRTPEYTKSGTTALNRGVKFSDGTMVDGKTKGNLDSGRPNQDASYSTYHWTKSICQTCGTINSVDGKDAYGFSRNVYGLNSCDHNFFLDFDNTTYTPYNENYHTTVLKAGRYCQFCKGTKARASEKRESHNFTETVDGQIGNNRFFISEKCDDCGYSTSEYVTAKSVVSSYYGNADNKSHTVTVSDLSDSGVHTSIRYGTSAGKCNLTSAPNYTDAGYYPVYYEISYKYQGETMTENGVSYVWLLEDKKDDNSGGTVIVLPEKHEHDYRYLETVAPSCDNLGYERWQCDGCGNLDKRNYTKATGHNYKAITIREATCKQGGLKLNLCDKCGSFYEETTPVGEHKYKTEKVQPTCRNVGYTNHICEICGNSYITDMTPIISHAYERITKEPTCTDKGYTTSTCTMCGLNYVSDYTEPTGHNWDEGYSVTYSTCTADGVIEYRCKNDNCSEKMIKAESATGHTPGKAATCTDPRTCEKCGTVLELPKGHSYSENVVKPTCTAMGYTEYKCDNCDDSYVGDYTDKLPHNYNANVTEPTCTEHGFTRYICVDCDDSYISDYTEKKPHNYNVVITKPTCTEFGYTTYTCADCGDSYVADYTDKTEHNYDKKVIPPTCTEHGYTVYTCPDCGKEYIGDYTEHKNHNYTKTVIAPTCTEMGYTIFTCDCGDTYKGEYTDKIAHTYKKTVTEPTCTEIGFTTSVCEVCGDTVKSDYKNAKGHAPSEWIIDEAATIEHGGRKHIECIECKAILQTADIPQLVAKDNSDEDGKAEIGKYSVILTDKNNKPVFNSEITINKDDNISIRLPKNRLLDFADRTTVTVFNTEKQTAATGLNIFVTDDNGNNATGVTDENGQFIAPDKKSSTGDDNGTIGKDDGDSKFTYVIKVTDKLNVTIPNCETYIGESNNIVVKLPDGLILTQDSPAIITVTDQNGNPQKGVSVIVIADKDYIEKGTTDMYGKLTVPPVNSGITDKDGKVNLQNYYVFVNDEKGYIENALVTLNEDNSFSVKLPAENMIDYANRITVTVLDKDGAPLKDISVTVSDAAEKSITDKTDENGKIVVPPMSEDYTDKDGIAKVGSYTIIVENVKSKIENAYITLTADGTISVLLPENIKIEHSNRITVTVLDKDNKGVKDISVTVKETVSETAENAAEPKTATAVTDKDGKIYIPPASEGVTDKDGNTDISETTPGKDTDGDGKDDTEETKTEYNITVEDTKGKIENAFIEIKDGKIFVTLPDGKTLTMDNQTTVTVLDKDSKAIKGVSVTIKDKTTEKTATTDANGKVTLPVKSTGGGGSSSGGGGGRGGSSGGGYYTTVNVKITDKDGKAVTNFSKSTDSKGNITIILPNGKTLDNGNFYTVTVTDNKGNAKENVTVLLKDRNKGEATGTTDKNGVVTIPGKTHTAYIFGYNDGTFRPDNNMSRAEAAAIFARLISEQKGEKISGKSDFADVKSSEWYSKFIGYIEKYGIIKGYDNNTFKPDENISRAEFVAMTVRFNSLFNKVKKGSYTVKYTDVASNYWAYADIAYAKHAGWLNGYADGSFKGDNAITRAEVVTVVNKATGRIADEGYINKNLSLLNKFTDLKNNSHWAFYSICESANTHLANSHDNSETWVK